MSDKEQEFNTLDLKVEFGEKIKQARIACDLSVDDVFKQSSIPAVKINEIESGARTTNNAMQRVYIIKYLKFLNIYNDEMIALLDQAYENNVDALTHTINIPSTIGDVSFDDEIKRRKHAKTVKTNIKKVGIIVIVIIALAALVFFLINSVKSNFKEVTSNETTLLTNTTLTPNDVIDTKPKIAIEDAKSGYVITGAEEYDIKITFKGDTYLEIPGQKVDGKTYTKDDEVSLKVEAGKQLNLKTGKAENLIITVNDTQLPEKKLIGVQTITLKLEKEAKTEANDSNQKKEENKQ